MTHLFGVLNLVTGLIAGIFILYGVIVSVDEKEYKAAGRLFLVLVAELSLYLFISLSQFPFYVLVNIVLFAITIITAILLFFPLSSKKEIPAIPLRNVDERDIMFSREELIPGTGRFNDYYKNRPEHLARDQKFRGKPGLLKQGTSLYHPLCFAAAQSGFDTVSGLRDMVTGPVSGKRTVVEQREMTNFIKAWAKKLGAADCGVTALKPYHFYTIGGRAERYGKAVNNDHHYAIAITVEMDKSMIDPAPKASVVMESAQKYLESGAIAVQIARFIRNNGYKARAHIDGNYEVICPLVARDAGLGEIGRMGLLMTPGQGPRVRIAVITTTLPLLPDKYNDRMGVQHFCSICEKCAASCPSKAIPFGDKKEIDGIRRWKIDAESCFTLWCDLGTDCARCIAVCPYSHPDNFFHRFVRWGIGNSRFFSRLAVIADDILYGKFPPSKTLPSWIKRV